MSKERQSLRAVDGSEMLKLVDWAQAVVTFHGSASAHLVKQVLKGKPVVASRNGLYCSRA